MKPSGRVFDRSYRAACAVDHGTRPEVRHMVERHYLGCFPAVVPCILCLRHDGMARGMVIFAYPPKQTSKRYQGLTWELARLWVDDDMPTNTESWLIGQAIRHVKREHGEVRAIVSYADPSREHTGAIYRAANFECDGMTDDDRKTPRFDYVAGGKRYQRRSHVPPGVPFTRVPRVSKYRYVYWLGGSREHAG